MSDIRWFKTNFIIHGPPESINQLARVLVVDNKIAFTNVLPIPDTLPVSLELDDIESDIYSVVEWLERTNMDIKHFRLCDLYTTDMHGDTYIANGDSDCYFITDHPTLNDFINEVIDDNEYPRVVLAMTFGGFCKHYLFNKTKRVVDVFKQLSKHGYTSQLDFILAEYGCSYLPEGNASLIVENGIWTIKGDCFSVDNIPIEFMKTLKKLYNVHIDINYLDVKKKHYVILDKNFSIVSVTDLSKIVE